MSARDCAVEGCASPSHARSMCNSHYNKWLRATPSAQRPTPGPSASARFWSRVEKGADCWLWLGSTAGKGYGSFPLNGSRVGAHRFAYEEVRGAIPAGLTVDHLCRNRLCVNPDHMEIVTRGENSRRGGGAEIAAANKRALRECMHGHPFDESNTYVGANGRRSCRACRRERRRAQSRRTIERKAA